MRSREIREIDVAVCRRCKILTEVCSVHLRVTIACVLQLVVPLPGEKKNYVGLYWAMRQKKQLFAKSLGNRFKKEQKRQVWFVTENMHIHTQLHVLLNFIASFVINKT